jgi:hypothetical protein
VDRDRVVEVARERPDALLTPPGVRADVRAQVDRIRGHLDDHVPELVEHLAPADHQVTAPLPQVRAEVGQCGDQVREPVRVGVARAEDRLVEHEQRHDPVGLAAGGSERRLVVDPQVAGEQHDGGGHGRLPGSLASQATEPAAGRTGSRIDRPRRTAALPSAGHDRPVLARFSVPVATWFETTFRAHPRAGAGVARHRGRRAHADPRADGLRQDAHRVPVGDRPADDRPGPDRDQRLRVVYVSPLRALAVDVDRNLRAPLEGIRLAAERLGAEVHRPEVGVRTGDTPSSERARMKRTPPDVLITTPESLYLLLTSQARETLRGVQAVIVDEIHAMAATKRGSHLALTLERLEHEVRRGGLDADAPDRPAPQRIALSATQRPLEEIARFLGGHAPTGPARGPSRSWTPACASRSSCRSSCRWRTWPARRAGRDRPRRGDDERRGGGRAVPAIDLAGGAPAAARPRARAPLDPDLRQRPSARGAAGRQAQRAARRTAAGGRAARQRAVRGGAARRRWPNPRTGRRRSS